MEVKKAEEVGIMRNLSEVKTEELATFYRYLKERREPYEKEFVLFDLGGTLLAVGEEAKVIDEEANGIIEYKVEQEYIDLYFSKLITVAYIFASTDFERRELTAHLEDLGHKLRILR